MTDTFTAEFQTAQTRATSDEDLARRMYEAGQRAERSRIADKLDAMAMQNFNGSWAHVILNLVDELRADPAESGE